MIKYILSILTIVFSMPAAACTFSPMSVESNYKNAKKVFLGSLISAERIDEGGEFSGGLKLTFIVAESFKGTFKSKEVIFTGEYGCGIPVEFAISYLIYSDESGRASVSTGSHGMLAHIKASGEWEYRDREKEVITTLRSLSNSNKHRQ